jgi:hypothetical protein
MPYLGNEPAVAYTSTTKDSFSGDGSTTDFTMSKSANVNAVRVVVENVVQNPTVAYTCSGTTIAFTSAPPTGTSNIYVVHLGPPAATVAPPTTINNATTFTGGVTLKNETAEDTDGGRESIVTFQGTQSGNEITTLAQIQASHDGTSDDEKGDLIFKTNDGSDGASPTERLRISSDGVATFTSSNTSSQVVIENTDAGSSSAPDLVFYRNSASPADNDLLGRVDFQGNDSAGNAMDYGVIVCKADNVADGSENGSLKFYVASAGEVAGATDTESLTIVSPQDIRINDSADTSDNTALKLIGGTSGYSSLQLGDTADANKGMLQYNHSTDHLRFTVNDTEMVEMADNQTSCFDGNSNFDGAGSIANNNTSAKQHVTIGGTGYVIANRYGGTPLYVNRMNNDGVVVGIYGQGTQEGTISVSGTTVTYNGGHLGRWSQLSDGSKDTSLVKGTVMTNLDKMAVWTHAAIAEGDEFKNDHGETVTATADDVRNSYTEDNEQLNCMAVSSEEGDANVAGVFVNWDNQDDGFNDMNVAMTGDMVIRIAQGVTVARGDLLMSAGDGTAKPQDDDIVRSKTIAKVTSTNVSHTYDDNSYLVPCVLMAC